jgi:phosphate transport system protein
MELIETKLDQLQGKVLEMAGLVKSQVHKSKEVLFNKDEELADAVIVGDEKIDEADVDINQNCEQILALFNPVAIDLRLILTSIKISLSLERIGDHAEGICFSFKEITEDFDPKYLEAFKIEEMFETAEMMLEDFSMALKNKDIQLAKSIYKKDRVLNKAYSKSVKTAAKLIKNDIKEVKTILQLLSVVRKVERIGDLTKNMSLEVIFHLTGKFPKRKPKGKKKKSDQ